jgi:hypothetical protein
MISNLVNNNCYLITLQDDSNDQICKKQLSSTEFSTLLKSIEDFIEINIGNYEIQIENEIKNISNESTISSSSNSNIKKQKQIVLPKQSINTTTNNNNNNLINNIRNINKPFKPPQKSIVHEINGINNNSMSNTIYNNINKPFTHPETSTTISSLKEKSLIKIDKIWEIEPCCLRVMRPHQVEGAQFILKGLQPTKVNYNNIQLTSSTTSSSSILSTNTKIDNQDSDADDDEFDVWGDKKNLDNNINVNNSYSGVILADEMGIKL